MSPTLNPGRSLLAGDGNGSDADQLPDRLQAGSYRATRSGWVLLAGAVVLLAGCATNPQSTPPALSSKLAVAPAVEARPAHITGSEQTSTMLDNFTAFITAVDGQPVTGGRLGWKTPLALRPGARRLAVEFNRGVFRARSEIALLAVSEASYQLRFDSDAQFLGKNSYCEFWIVDAATGQAITPRIRADLSRSEPAK